MLSLRIAAGTRRSTPLSNSTTTGSNIYFFPTYLQSLCVHFARFLKNFQIFEATMEILCSKSEKSMWPPPVILGLTCCMTRLGNSLGLTDKCSSGRGWVGATGSPPSSTRGGGAWPLFSFSPAHPSTATSTWTGSV